MDFKEMEKRYSDGEDSLDLTVEKWNRIYDYLESAFSLGHFTEALQASGVPIFLCIEYKDRCELCPLFRICERGKSEDFNKVIRVIQSYTIAGDILPKEPLLGVVKNFIEELKQCKSDARGKAH
ncbi:MAG: hypothetical protein AMJ42_03575 [Deltaproteobacteria bacterium DG_8]|nr:MAG: hypothetical protein AMJ42_03575 [Deltaproteobacteria bacterium DG_8]